MQTNCLKSIFEDLHKVNLTFRQNSGKPWLILAHLLLTSSLSQGTTYTVRVQIRNKFGVSESLHVPVVTLLEPIKQLAETKVKEDTEERNEAILAMIIGGLVTLVMLVLVILLISFSYRRRLLEHSAATLNSTSARLLETSPEQKQERAEYSSYTLDSKQSTTTFNSNVFVPSISSDVYGQVRKYYYKVWIVLWWGWAGDLILCLLKVVDKPGVNALNTLRRQKPFHSNNIQVMSYLDIMSDTAILTLW